MFCVCYFFFFKQKTAYEVRISDWSSDVCSSDLHVAVDLTGGHARIARGLATQEAFVVTEIEVGFGAILGDEHFAMLERAHRACIDVDVGEIGRASCRERVCQYV